MFVYKGQKIDSHSSDAKRDKSKLTRVSKNSSKTAEQVITSKRKSNNKNQSKKLTKKNKEFLKQLGFSLKK